MDKQELQDLYDKFGSIRAIADNTGLDRRAIKRQLLQHGIELSAKPRKRCKHKDNIDVAAMHKLYLETGSLRKAAKQFGCDSGTVSRLCRGAGLNVANLVRHCSNDLFFEECNEKSLYWAGFIAADGCVKQRIGRKSSRFELQIGLAIRDEEHLITFKADIGTSSPIRRFIVKNSLRNQKWNDCETSQITITSEKLFNSLAHYNIVPRKSLIYTFPEWVVEHPFVNHFMRGYFDGDGSWFWQHHKTKAPQLYFSLRGTPEFLTTYRLLLERHCGLLERDKPIRINNGIGVLEYGGNGVCRKIGEFLYHDATRYLGRKADVYKQTANTSPTLCNAPD